MIGRGTVSQIGKGTGHLDLRLSRQMAAKLHKLHHLTITVRLVVYGADGAQLATDVAGRY